jgi:hypothetical protein
MSLLPVAFGGGRGEYRKRLSLRRPAFEQAIETQDFKSRGNKGECL